MKKTLLCIILLLTAFVNIGFSQSHQISSQSVVKIKTVFTNKSGQVVNGTGTGWCYYNPFYIVTALHVVAGVTNIKVYKDNSFVDATIERVILKADLALLKLSGNLNLKPLSIERVDPNSEATYYVWGFPRGVYAIQGNRVDFALTREVSPTLNSILNETSKQVKIDLTNQGYPLPEVQIIRIGSILQPGQSGAPIFTPQGTVIGVADGGLYGGTASINWAMPASTYVPLLLSSNDRKPTSLPFQTNLMSTTVVDQNATDAQQKAKMEKEEKANTVSKGIEDYITKTFTAGFDQIVATLPEVYALSLRKVADDSKYNTQNLTFDVYQDSKTGLSLTMPVNAKTSIYNNYWYSNQTDNGLSYNICTWQCKTFDIADKDAAGAIDRTFSPDKWFKSPKYPDQRWVSQTNNQYVIYRMRRVNKEGNWVEYYIDVLGGNLFLRYVTYREDWLGPYPEYRKKYTEYHLASQTYNWKVK